MSRRLPPDPDAMRISAATIGDLSDLDYPQLIVDISYAVENLEGDATISIDREITANGLGFVEVVDGLTVADDFYPDVFTVPLGTTELRWRVRVVQGGETVLSRTTSYITYSQR